MSEFPPALEITLRRLKPLAPPFHRHIARGKLVGKSCQVGDRVVVYEVVHTLPEGKVLVGEDTLFRFEDERVT